MYAYKAIPDRFFWQIQNLIISKSTFLKCIKLVTINRFPDSKITKKKSVGRAENVASLVCVCADPTDFFEISELPFTSFMEIRKYKSADFKALKLMKRLVGHAARNYTTPRNNNGRNFNKKSHTSQVKRLNQKELTSRPVGLSFHGVDALSLSLLKIAGTTADKNWKERKLSTFVPPCPRLQTLTADGQSQLFKMQSLYSQARLFLS